MKRKIYLLATGLMMLSFGYLKGQDPRYPLRNIPSAPGSVPSPNVASLGMYGEYPS